MIRSFLDEFAGTMRRKWTGKTSNVHGTVVTGKIFFPTLRQSVEEMNRKFGTDLQCLPVDNLYFGAGITVAGLLTGSDIFAAVKDRLHGDFLVVPSESMAGEHGLFLDDWVRADLEERLGLPVFGGGYHADEFFRQIFSAERARRREVSLSSS
jgi:NifB/MoaA-like Fe-S oxidoreductase